MENFGEILKNFKAISLAEMDAVELMNRKDTKYFFPISKLNSILSALDDDYSCLKINEHTSFTYRNIYFDTADFKMYYHHHNEYLNRYKIRIRQYLESNLVFLEIKFKTNTERTIKSRIQIPDFSEILTPEAKLFIESITPFNPEDLVPMLRNDFVRFTLVSNLLNERVTLDTDMSLIAGKETMSFPKLCIAELKHGTSSSGSRFKSVMRQNTCPEMRISKYSIGAAYMYPHLKQNNWKPKQIRINRIEYV